MNLTFSLCMEIMIFGNMQDLNWTKITFICVSVWIKCTILLGKIPGISIQNRPYVGLKLLMKIRLSFNTLTLEVTQISKWLKVHESSFKTSILWLRISENKYRTGAIITRGLYTFYPLPKTFFQGAFFLKFWPYVWLVFKSGF